MSLIYDYILGKLRVKDVTDLTTVNSRITTLENNVYKILYFQTISAATGTITKPTNSTILLDQFYSGGDAIVETLSNGQPTGQSPLTGGGSVVSVTSFDVNGNYVLSGTPSAFDVALVYILTIKAIDYGNLNVANIMAMEDFNAGGGGISGLTTNELVYGNSATSIASLAVATYPSLTELSYVKGVTSDIQTQLANAGEWKTLTAAVLSPADSVAYLMPFAPTVAPAATTGARVWKFTKSGTVLNVNVAVQQSVNGSSEAVTVYLRNNTTATDYLCGTFTMDGGVNANTFANYSVSIPINTTDLWAIKILTPAWVTNPTGVYFAVQIFNKS